MSRNYFPGMGVAVANRTVNRLVFTDRQRAALPETLAIHPDDLAWQKAAKVSNHPFQLDEDSWVRSEPPETRPEEWHEVALRVAEGNTSLDRTADDEKMLRFHIGEGTILLSGRHLQHGDRDQATRPMEVFTNCSTAILRSLTFMLLLSGSGVGGSYDDDLMIVDWTKMPIVVCALDDGHPDKWNGLAGGYPTVREAQHQYAGQEQILFQVPDTREGWAKAVEMIETLAYQGRTDVVLIIDFTAVRPAGAPIRGMQNRPASGPGPLMAAIGKAATIRNTTMAPWKAAMFIDHYLAECVLVGGARRAARIAVKYWRDPTIFEFINIKRPVEYRGKTMEEIAAIRAAGKPGSFLWSSNNSVAVDQAFWDAVNAPFDTPYTAEIFHARRVWAEVMAANYGDGTGEPGFLNVDKLSTNHEGLEVYERQAFAGSKLYRFGADMEHLVRDVTKAVLRHAYQFIVNPCGEIVLFILGAFCVIGDLALYHAADGYDEENATRSITRALIRTNLMPSIYQTEVERTNRIGVSLTGVHEWAWARFGLAFRDLIEADPDGLTLENGLAAPSMRAWPFWQRLSALADVVDEESEVYSRELGVVAPHTRRTIKPAGTTSKLFGLTEGAHLPAMREYLRWVQFRHDDPDVAKYRALGYPTRELKSYKGTTIVGFPTQPVICSMGLGDKLVTASEATPEEQFRWLRLLETFWIGGDTGNQISYTLKYDPKVVSFDAFKAIMLQNVPDVRAVSVLPKEDELAYEYQPEERISAERYAEIVAGITDNANEDVDKVHVDCAGGACPVDFEKAA